MYTLHLCQYYTEEWIMCLSLSDAKDKKQNHNLFKIDASGFCIIVSSNDACIAYHASVNVKETGTQIKRRKEGETTGGS